MNKTFTFFLMCLIFLLFGCIEIRYEQVVDEQGNSEFTIIMDQSSMMEMMKLQNQEIEQIQEQEMNFKIDNPCENIDENIKNHIEFCDFDEDKFISTIKMKKISSLDGGYEFIKQEGLFETKYTLRVDDLSKLTKTIGSQDESMGLDSGKLILTDPENKQSAPMLKMMGLVMTYTVVMPGEIIKAEGGIIDKEANKAEFNLIEMMENTQIIEVESKKTNIFPIILIIGLIGMALIGTIVFLIRKKGTNEKNVYEKINEEIKQNDNEKIKIE